MEGGIKEVIIYIYYVIILDCLIWQQCIYACYHVVHQYHTYTKVELENNPYCSHSESHLILCRMLVCEGVNEIL